MKCFDLLKGKDIVAVLPTDIFAVLPSYEGKNSDSIKRPKQRK